MRAAHRRELVRSKEEMLQLLASAEEKSLRVDEDSIRKKYVKEIDRIKVSENMLGGATNETIVSCLSRGDGQ